jgi:hypothetical protein
MAISITRRVAGGEAAIARLNEDELPAVQRLREMRNLAAHSVDPPISITDALRYHDMVQVLINAIKQRSVDK